MNEKKNLYLWIHEITKFVFKNNLWATQHRVSRINKFCIITTLLIISQSEQKVHSQASRSCQLIFRCKFCNSEYSKLVKSFREQFIILKSKIITDRRWNSIAFRSLVGRNFLLPKGVEGRIEIWIGPGFVHRFFFWSGNT